MAMTNEAGNPFAPAEPLNRKHQVVLAVLGMNDAEARSSRTWQRRTVWQRGAHTFNHT